MDGRWLKFAPQGGNLGGAVGVQVQAAERRDYIAWRKFTVTSTYRASMDIK